ncbi:MarR family winged helix-turn-helix transcriptional regulator [Ferviditalea candida]|uniref:MarR family transcriptional regulator n=1 Tax=Ferviditalea candida TaxID=3108399 RepID=A0ABU5ZJQ9_9BACL|nr:MarR family transcriptional regulator [Paenibacillaceae bacterium T2]
MENQEVLEQFIAYLQNLNRFMRASAFDADTHQITRVQWLLLRHLHRKGTTSIGHLAKHLDVRPSTMSQMIDRLEKTDLVCRKTDLQDARFKKVRLTSKGLSMIRQVESLWLEALSNPFGHLSTEEKHALLHLLAKLNDNLPKRGGFE